MGIVPEGEDSEEAKGLRYSWRYSAANNDVGEMVMFWRIAIIALFAVAI